MTDCLKGLMVMGVVYFTGYSVGKRVGRCENMDEIARKEAEEIARKNKEIQMMFDEFLRQK